MPADAFTSLIAFIRLPEISAVLLTAAFAVIATLLRRKSNVVWGVTHGFCFGIPQNSGGTRLFYTKSVIVKNIGRAAANGLEIHFGSKPEHYQLWPTFGYTVSTNPENHYCVKIDNFGQQENFSIEMIQSDIELPNVLRVRTASGECKQVNLAPNLVFPKWFNCTVLFLLLLGIYTVFEIAVRHIIY